MTAVFYSCQPGALRAPPPLGALPLDAATLARWQEWRVSNTPRRETLVCTGQLAPAQAAALERLEANRAHAGSAAEPGWAAAVLDGLHVPEGRDGKRTLALLAQAVGACVGGDMFGPARQAGVETALARYLRPLWQAARTGAEAKSPWREESPATETVPQERGEEREEREMMAEAVTERPVKKWPCGREKMARIAALLATREGGMLTIDEREAAAKATGTTVSTFDTCYYALRRDPEGSAALLAETETATPTEEPAPVVPTERSDTRWVHYWGTMADEALALDEQGQNPCGHPTGSMVANVNGMVWCSRCSPDLAPTDTSGCRTEHAPPPEEPEPEAVSVRDQLDLARGELDTWMDAHSLAAHERDELRERVAEMEREAERLRAERAIHRLDELKREAEMEREAFVRALSAPYGPPTPAYAPHEHVYALTGRELLMAYHVAEAVEEVLRELHEVTEVPTAVWDAAGEMLVLVDDGEGGAS